MNNTNKMLAIAFRTIQHVCVIAFFAIGALLLLHTLYLASFAAHSFSTGETILNEVLLAAVIMPLILFFAALFRSCSDNFANAGSNLSNTDAVTTPDAPTSSNNRPKDGRHE